MGDYRKIFLIVDPAHRRSPAYRRAVRLARDAGAELHLGLYEHSPAIAAAGRVNREVGELARRAFVREREGWLGDMATALTDGGVVTFSEVESRTPVHEAIATRILELHPDLVVKDVHHEPALSRLLFTPLDWQLLRLCPAPLLLVNRRANEVPRRVIAAVDTLPGETGDDALNERIFEQGRILAAQCNAELHLAHAFEWLSAALPYDLGGVAVLSQAYAEMQNLDRGRFDAFAAAHGVPPERRHLLSGPPAAAVADLAADALADLVVLGTIHRTGLERLIIGSTAERVLDLLRCDLLAVKPLGFEADLARHLGFAPASVEPRKAA